MSSPTCLSAVTFLALIAHSSMALGGNDVLHLNGFEGDPIGGVISGRLFFDPNFDGDLSDGEPLGGGIIYLDANFNAMLDPGERLRTTDANGSYLFDSLTEGLYHVRQTRGGDPRTAVGQSFI